QGRARDPAGAACRRGLAQRRVPPGARGLMRGLRSVALALSGAALLAATPAVASPPEAATTRLSVARLEYDGDDWYANPSALPNLIKALRARTTLDVEPQEARLKLDDDRIRDHPFLDRKSVV